jgi:hypothetical protein
MADQPMVVSPEEYRARQIAESKAEAERLQMDVAPQGGRYKVGDRVVNANGEVIKDAAEPFAVPAETPKGEAARDEAHRDEAPKGRGTR